MNKNNTNTHMVDYHADLIGSLGDYEVFMLALKHLAEAKGGINKLAKKAHLNRHLYRVLSKSGNPRLDTLSNLMHALGFRLSVSKIKKVA